MKEMYIACLEEWIAEYMDEHPNASWDDAYKAATDGPVDHAYEAMREKLADMADARPEAADRRWRAARDERLVKKGKTP